MKDNRWGIVPVIWRTAQPTNIHLMFPAITRIYLHEHRLQHEYCTAFLSLTTIYRDLCNLKIAKFIIFQFLSTRAVARHKSFFKLFYKFFEIFLFCTMLTVTFLLLPDPPSQLVSFCFQHSKSILCSPSILECVVLYCSVINLPQTILSETGDFIQFMLTVDEIKFIVFARLKIHFFPYHCWKSFLHLRLFLELIYQLIRNNVLHSSMLEEDFF